MPFVILLVLALLLAAPTLPHAADDAQFPPQIGSSATDSSAGSEATSDSGAASDATSGDASGGASGDTSSGASGDTSADATDAGAQDGTASQADGSAPAQEQAAGQDASQDAASGDASGSQQDSGQNAQAQDDASGSTPDQTQDAAQPQGAQAAPQTGDAKKPDASQDSDNKGWKKGDAAAPAGAGNATSSQPPGLATPSPYDDSEPAYNKPFSLAPMHSFKPQRGALTVVSPGMENSEDIEVEASACDQLTTSGGPTPNMEDFKKSLVEKAKSQAAFNLLTRMYAGQSQVGLQEKLPASYKEALASKLQTKGQPSFYNGKVFGELCAKITATLSSENVDTASPLIATLQNFCYQAPDTTEEQLEALAHLAALDRVVQNIAPGAKLSSAARNELLQGATISGELGGDHDDVYCLDMHLEVAPLQLQVHVPTKQQLAAQPSGLETLAARLKPHWSLDLSAYSPGSPVPEYGKNLVVYKDANGKSLGPNSRDGAMVIMPLTSAPNFTVRVLVSRKISWDFLYSETFEFFRMHFANKAWEQAAFVMSMNDKNEPEAYFQSRTSSSATFPWDMAVNFDDLYIVKQGKEMRFFFNGLFIMTYPTAGDSLTQVRVPLKWDDRLYNVLVENQGDK